MPCVLEAARRAATVERQPTDRWRIVPGFLVCLGDERVVVLSEAARRLAVAGTSVFDHIRAAVNSEREVVVRVPERQLAARSQPRGRVRHSAAHLAG
jgi:hypothetical protein